LEWAIDKSNVALLSIIRLPKNMKLIIKKLVRAGPRWATSGAQFYYSHQQKELYRIQYIFFEQSDYG